MQTMKNTPYQTIQANSKKLAEIATWYATTAAAETLEAGRSEKSDGLLSHIGTADLFSRNARISMSLSKELEEMLEERRAKDAAPAIEKAGRC